MLLTALLCPPLLALELVSASCEVRRRNALRVDCTAVTDMPATVTFRSTPIGGGHPSIASSEAGGRLHGATLVGLAPETGHLLTSCSSDDSIREYDTTGALVWQATITCDDGSDPSDTSRALPITPTGW